MRDWPRGCANSECRWPRRWSRKRRRSSVRRGRSAMPVHNHQHETGAIVSRKLMIASIATALFVAVEIVVGIRANSLALIGDALHNVTDTLALLLALFAVRVERRPATSAKSYGWHRAGVLAAFINAGALAAFTIFLFVEAAERLRAPAGVNSRSMLVTAA